MLKMLEIKVTISIPDGANKDRGNQGIIHTVESLDDQFAGADVLADVPALDLIDRHLERHVGR